MRRCSRQLALFLVLGAVINYALAMGIIWVGPLGEWEDDAFRFDGALLLRETPPGMTILHFAPRPPDEPLPEAAAVPAWSRIHHLSRPLMSLQEWLSLPDPVVYCDVAAGWPMRSVVYRSDTHPRRPPGSQIIITSGIELPTRQMTHPARGWGHPRAIPLRIIPAGFAINTLFFAALAAMLWYTPAAIHSFRHKRGNQCLKCGYSREGLADGAVCPECGTSSAAAVPAA